LAACAKAIFEIARFSRKSFIIEVPVREKKGGGGAAGGEGVVVGGGQSEGVEREGDEREREAETMGWWLSGGRPKRGKEVGGGGGRGQRESARAREREREREYSN